MVPTFLRVTFILKDLIEDKVNKGESKISITPYITKAALDIIGLVGKGKNFFLLFGFYKFFLIQKKNKFLGFNHEFNSLTSPSELANAYGSLMSILHTSTLSFSIGVLSVFVPFIRRIPIDINNKYNYSREVIVRESKRLIDEKYEDDKYNKLNGKDLLSSLVKINKTLPTEEKLTYDELKYQVVKKKNIPYICFFQN